MADAAAVILSAIEKLDSWLLADKKLRSLRLEMKDLLVGMAEVWKNDNEMLSSFLVGVADQLYSVLGEMDDIWELNCREKLHSLLVQMLDLYPYPYTCMEKFISLAVEMGDLWEDSKGKLNIRDDDHTKLCSLRSKKKDLLVGMMEVWENDNEMLYSLLVEVADLWDEEEKFDDDKLYSFLGEMDDIWEVNCREKLFSLAVEMLDMDPYFYREKFLNLGVEMADLWKDKDSKGKLNKQKLYSCLAKKTDLWEEDKLFRLLESMTSLMIRHLDEEDWKKYVEGVRNDLRLILDILNKLEDEGSSKSHLHYFMSDVVEIAHDVQLLIRLKDSDPFILFLRILSLYEIKIGAPDLSYSALNFFDEIKPIYEWLRETKERVRKFGGDETSQINNVREEVVGPSPTYSESDHRAVGLEEDVELLLRNARTTICIHGLPGSGKTTLAREFYNHPEIVDGYECRGWVCLSSWKLSRKELLIQLIGQLIDSSKRDDMVIEKMENKALQQMLHQHLQDKPYVIILDDVSEETYPLLQYVYRMLPEEERSRLLFTTRSHQIRCLKFEDYEHKMKNLDGDKSWQLLLRTALCSDEKFPKQLEKKGREMLMRKCGGLPLAIKEVGRHWAEKRRSGSEWKELVVEESFMNLELTETLVAFEWTYLNMEPDVKPCFLSLAFFKEGTIIRYKKFQHIFKAGLPGCRESFYELKRQSIIEEVDDPKSHQTKAIRINPVFHRLSIIKAVDEIGFEILRKDGSNRASHEPRRHRVIHCSRDDKFNYNYSSTNQDEHLVSLFFHGGGGLSNICWKHFARLKVLDMEDFGLKILSETVGDLIELRYLGLRNNYIQELPQSLRRLKMIEVLDIAQNFMVEVPDILWEMDGLRHLYMSDIICQKLLKIDALTNLETLTYITVDDWTYDMSDMKNKMASLRRLGIEEVDGNSNISKLFASLAELRKLDCLILRGFRFRNMPSLDELGLLKNIRELKLEGRLTRLPSATNFPPEIKYLSLVNSCLDEDPMPILEKLPDLSHLKLQNAYTGHEMVISSTVCRKFSDLVIRELWNLRNIVKVGESVRPSPITISEMRGMMEVWENDKEMLYRFLVEVADLWDVKEKKVDNDKLYSFLGEIDDIWELNCREKLHVAVVMPGSHGLYPCPGATPVARYLF
ncbi:hypothetical protein C2S52_023520 [Perilla frutescens var. hirtella]|nr:hypothetical protein C2S52_023520 [Perilla frutescens var. hirtella]